MVLRQFCYDNHFKLSRDGAFTPFNVPGSAARGRYSEFAGVWLALLSPGVACGHVGFAASLESTITLVRDVPKP